MTTTYPIDWIRDYDTPTWGRLHQGHGLSPADLLADLIAHGGQGHTPDDGYRLVTTELHLVVLPRVKWCERHDSWPCDNQGEWHTHWASVQPNPDPKTHFTAAFWERTGQYQAPLRVLPRLGCLPEARDGTVWEDRDGERVWYAGLTACGNHCSTDYADPGGWRTDRGNRAVNDPVGNQTRRLTDFGPYTEVRTELSTPKVRH